MVSISYCCFKINKYVSRIPYCYFVSKIVTFPRFISPLANVPPVTLFYCKSWIGLFLLIKLYLYAGIYNLWNIFYLRFMNPISNTSDVPYWQKPLTILVLSTDVLLLVIIIPHLNNRYCIIKGTWASLQVLILLFLILKQILVFG